MGSIIGGTSHGDADAIIDPRGAVLLDHVTVAVVGAKRHDDPTVQRAVALSLSGRVNRDTARHDVLYLMDEDGAASLVAELMGLAERGVPGLFDRIATALDAIRKETGRGAHREQR